MGKFRLATIFVIRRGLNPCHLGEGNEKPSVTAGSSSTLLLGSGAFVHLGESGLTKVLPWEIYRVNGICEDKPITLHCY